ncbi:hypothetical protein ACQP00_39625 [Dactylosporangium sp. CS-047395]|uniref:hypothetical protein n=1 Tax=Dactylosporangium sp. CS-047395 TaxID=3239936 RepID=UPI003D92A671
MLGPILTMFYLVNATTDTESARAAALGRRCADEGPHRVGLILTVLLLCCLVTALILSTRRRTLPTWAARGRDVAPVVVLAVCVTSALLVGDIATRSAGFILSPGWIYAYLVIT